MNEHECPVGRATSRRRLDERRADGGRPSKPVACIVPWGGEEGFLTGTLRAYGPSAARSARLRAGRAPLSLSASLVSIPRPVLDQNHRQHIYEIESGQWTRYTVGEKNETGETTGRREHKSGCGCCLAGVLLIPLYLRLPKHGGESRVNPDGQKCRAGCARYPGEGARQRAEGGACGGGGQCGCEHRRGVAQRVGEE